MPSRGCYRKVNKCVLNSQLFSNVSSQRNLLLERWLSPFYMMSPDITAGGSRALGTRKEQRKKDFPFVKSQSSPGERSHFFSQVYINCKDSEAGTQEPSWASKWDSSRNRNGQKEVQGTNVTYKRTDPGMSNKYSLKTTELYLGHGPEHIPEIQELSLSGCLGERPS